MPSHPAILLTTLNAKYIHASLGLRYLLANMGELRHQTALREFTIARPAEQIVTDLLASLPPAPAVGIIGFGVYIWNVTQTTAVIRRLKELRPEIRIVLGGPEVSHEFADQEIVQRADYLITGWGDLSFAKLCHALLHGPRPLNKLIAGEQPPLIEITLPYEGYTDEDLKHRLLYVEASRGCPFKCEFCLSALDKSAWAFDLSLFLVEMQRLYDRGARNFKFVDRTFNLKVETSVRILQFFLDRLAESEDKLFVHFEVIPDHLPEALKAMIARFPPGVLQFEIGIQSFNSDVQKRISRRQDNAKSEANLRWLLSESNAHLHTDLIFGLPGESLASFAAGFDRLYEIGPHEIQLGILKRLRGTPIARHTVAFGMVFDLLPPYTVTQTGAVDRETMQKFSRFARYWDMIANSGRFPMTLRYLLRDAPSPFAAFMAFADWLWAVTGKTSGLSPEMLVDALFAYFSSLPQSDVSQARQCLLADYLASGARSNPLALQGLLPKRENPASQASTLTHRQARHLAAQ